MVGAEATIIPTATRTLAGFFSWQGTRDFFFKWDLNTSLLDDFKTQVNSAEASFRDAEKKRIEVEEIPGLEQWLRDVRSALYDAEDLLEKIWIDVEKENISSVVTPVTRQSVIEKFKSEGKSVVRKLDYKRKDIIGRIHPYKETRESQMSLIKNRLQLLTSQKAMKLEHHERLIELQDGRCTSSHNNTSQSQIVGRSESEREILELLSMTNGEDDQLRVIAIIGMGGIGKTTVASMVYNRYETLAHPDSIFTDTCWVWFSYAFKIVNVIKSLLVQLKVQSAKESVDREFLLGELKIALKNKRFLFVFDDVWNNDQDNISSTFRKDWEALCTIFSVGAPGSRIIVTTREENISAILNPSHVVIHKLQKLSEADGWSLFQSLAFRNVDSSKHPSLEKIGKGIARKCDGCPLAIKMLATTLNNRIDEVRWNSVLTSQIWDSAKKVLPSLWLSYIHLPHPIKQCFAYFSIFPKKYVFSMKKMTRFWIAEGFVGNPCESGSVDDEDIAQTYFERLSENFFIEPSSHGRSKSGFVMHDLICDLAKYVSSDVTVDLTGLREDSPSRRLPYIRDHTQIFNSRRSFRYLKRLRTFLHDKWSWMLRDVFNNKVCNDLLSNFKLLRVLSLEGYSISVMPSSIGDMKLLRYLNFSRTNIEYLPQWICRLHCLLILKISHCVRLRTLPAELCHLINLRHLIAKGIRLEELPDGIGKMVSLRTLPIFTINEGQSKKLEEFGTLYNLRGKLEILGLSNVTNLDYVKTANFGKNGLLQELVLYWAISQGRDTALDEGVLDAISPHKNLKRLTVNGFGGKSLSNWIVGTSITTLCIKNCFNCQTLPLLGSMPLLEDLSIENLVNLESLGEEFYGKTVSSFPALQVLSIKGMKILKTWHDCGRRFPSLKKLTILECRVLGPIPDSLCFPSLTWLEIEDCFKLGSLTSLGSLEHLKDVKFTSLDRWESLDEHFYGSSRISFPALETLSLNYMDFLEKWCFPGGDRGGFCSLKKLELVGCERLIDIPYCFYNLFDHEISYCPTLVRLDNMGAAQEGWGSSSRTYGPSLRNITIIDCTGLTEIPKCFDNLAQVCISYCSSLTSVPGNLQQVKKLRLSCVTPVMFSQTNGVQMTALEELVILSSSPIANAELLSEKTGLLKYSTSLKSLTINFPFARGYVDDTGDSVIEEDDDKDLVVTLPGSITDLTIAGDIHRKILAEVSYLKLLTQLVISNCHALKSFPDAELPPELKYLEFRNCEALTTIPEKFLGGCINGLVRLILVNCGNLAQLPNVIHNATALHALDILRCPKLTPPEDGLPSMIAELSIPVRGPAPNLKLSALTSLKLLSLGGSPETITLDHCIPDSVTHVSISGFPRLKSISGVLRAHKQPAVFILNHCQLITQKKVDSWSKKYEGVRIHLDEARSFRPPGLPFI